MISMLWKWLSNRYNISIKFFSAHHPETDDQIESATRVMKNYFWAYINHMQDDWVDNLPIAEFAASNYVNASTGVTLFFVDYGFYL